MERLSTTPFGQRPVTAGLLAAQAAAQRTPDQPKQDKWTLLEDLCVARPALGVSDRDLAVLNALLSFLPGRDLVDGGDLVVFPSNRALSQRAHGMAESTLRRHLAALVRAGLILRHDSPNGKRYAARDATGAVLRAFGFDLRPLLVRAREIGTLAAQMRAAEENRRRLREEAVLRLRDARKLIAYGIETIPAQWDDLDDLCRLSARALRRKLDTEALEALVHQLTDLLTAVHDRLQTVGEQALIHAETEVLSGSDNHSERHYHSSNKDSSDFEPCLEKQRGKVDPPSLPLSLVLKACPEIQLYGETVSHWHELVALATFVRAMLGISPHAWSEAVDIMGPEVAAITVACILERADSIRSPGGYLRSLTLKAQNSAFSPAPMVMACLTRQSEAA